MTPYIADWLALLIRWFHFVAGISWIGASFYFIWLDDNLTAPQKPEDARRGVLGELWSVHGGGFYHNQKYLTGPKDEPLSQNLHWFKWEAYSTWLSGMAMLAVVYYANASAYLIDTSVMNLTPAAAIAVSIGTLVIGWVVYDTLCKILRSRQALLAVLIFALSVFAAWGLQHVFSGRAAYIQIGSILGTIMVANVLFVIIPGQRKMLAQIRAGQEPDPEPGRLGKIRSVHNTYFTLPVLFTMISNHYPMTYASGYGWLVIALLGAAGVAVRYFFILTHKHRIDARLPLAACVLIAVAAVIAAPRLRSVTAAQQVSFAQIAPIVKERCAVCHSVKPVQPGFPVAPAGVLLDTPEEIRANAQRIYVQAVQAQTMPLGNVTGMTTGERDRLGAWISQGAKL